MNNEGENALHISVKECHFPIVNKIINYVRKKKPPNQVPANGPTASMPIVNSEQTVIEESDPVKELINQQNKVSSLTLILRLSIKLGEYI